MKICFIGNMNSCHMVKWVQYFIDKGHFISKWHIVTFIDGYWKVERIKRYLLKQQFDVVHAHYAGLCGLIGALINYHPFLITVWGSDVLVNSKSCIKRPFLKWILKKADLITCDAEYVKEFMIHKLGISNERTWNIPKNSPCAYQKIKIIRHGVDLEKFKPNKEIKCPEPMVITLRSYDPDTLNKAKTIVRRDFPACYFREPSSYGHIKSWFVPACLNHTWIYVDISPIDAGLSSATAEAMACGLPVVITDIGENKDWVDPYYCIPPRRPDLLAGRIIELLNDPVQRKVQGEKNRQMIVSCNDYHCEMANMEKLYQEVSNG